MDRSGTEVAAAGPGGSGPAASAGTPTLDERANSAQEPKLGTRQARLAQEMYEAGELTVAQIAAEFGVTRPTIYRHLDRLDEIEAQQDL